LALVLSVASAQLAPLPDEPQFNQPVEFSTQSGGESLRSMIVALARAIDLTPIVESVPDVTITYDIGEPKPFRQVWNIVLTLNDLDYVLLENGVVVVGPTDQIAGLREAPAVEPVAEEPTAEPTVQQFYRVNNDPDQVVGIVQRAVPEVSVEALPGVRSIVVVGTEAQQDQVQSVLDQFDTAIEIVPLEQRIYRLSNARAVDLAAVLQQTNIVAGAQAAVAGAEGAAAAPTTAEDAFSVTADERTNSLIVTATPSIQARLADIIPQLDTPQQQVNVQVRIQEITQRAATDLGINLAAGFGNFSANLLSSGLRFIFDTSEVLTSLNVSAVLDTLEAQGLSRRVDDSNLTILNNETGTLQSGGRIEIQFPSTDGQLATRTIEFGVIIEVTPRVSADGRVILDVSAEVSDILVPLATGGIPERIDFSEREVTSTVSLASGQTVLLGGLLQNQFSMTEDRVPILGDIPIIGALFGTTSQSEESTELLLVVTANVIE
jgi:type II secretory pathway component GspD/PulD (secretin)